MDQRAFAPRKRAALPPTQGYGRAGGSNAHSDEFDRRLLRGDLPLDIRPRFSYIQRISLNRGTPFRKACLKGGARAVPAGELPIAPGRLWGTTRPALGPVGGEPAGLDKREAGKTPASAPSQETWFWS